MDHADAARLDELEADIAAVASAMESLDRAVAESPDAHAAAAEIAVIVSPERFPLEGELFEDSEAAASQATEPATADPGPYS